MIGGALTYGYSNARIRSLAAKLLEEDAVEMLIRADSVESALSILADSTYSAEFSELSVLHSGAELADHAISSHFSKVCRKVLNMTPVRSKAVIEAVLARWDIQDLKTILLGKHIGKDKAEIGRLLMRGGSLTAAELEPLLNSQGVVQAVKYMGDLKYGRAALQALPEYERSMDITPLLEALDRSYILHLDDAVRKTDDRLVKEVLKADIDAKNIMTVVRSREDGSMDPDKVRGLLIPAGRLTIQDLESIMSSKDWPTQLARVSDMDLSAPIEAYRRDRAITPIEDALQGGVARLAKRAFRISVLSLAALVGFLYVKEYEIRKIQRIIHAKEYGAGEETVRESVYGGGRDGL
ncbi:MAG: V-type ATPase subunit [Candidatus Altiarchaeota archaeon]